MGGIHTRTRNPLCKTPESSGVYARDMRQYMSFHW
ncbi:hypothetical protein CEXT_552601, partial [Caerostris extrusa]